MPAWNDVPAGTALPALWEQDGAVLATGSPLLVTDTSSGRVLGLRADGDGIAGQLWISLPEPAVQVTAFVLANGPVAVRAWSGGVAGDQAALPSGPGTLTVTGTAVQAVTVDFIGVESQLATLCWLPASAARTPAADRADRLTTAVQRWTDVQPILEPDCHYRLELTTRARLTAADGTPVQDLETTKTVRFQTGGPPGVVPDRLGPPPAPATAFPFGGPLADLTPYVERTVPDPAAAPVFRGYDLSCTFRTGTVPQLYGGDLALRLSGDDGTSLDLGVDWQQAATTTVSEADSAWLARLLACAGRPAGGLRGDDVLVASLPAGTVLPANRMLTARLLATRPLFTDPFDDLAGFDQQVLDTGAAVTSCSAAGGVATIARPRNQPGPVVALAGDPEMAGCTVTGAATPRGAGSFGLVAGYGGPGRWLALELTVGGGRKLVVASPAGPRTTERVLWQDGGDVRRGTTYALSLTCAEGLVTARIDDVEVSVQGTVAGGRFGLLSGIPGPDGCEFTDLLVRSAPATTVYSWRFTTSAHPGLPELLATFAGRTWPAEGTLDAAGLRTQAGPAADRMAAAAADVTAARAELAAAVTAGDAVDLQALAAAAAEAVSGQQAVAAELYRELAATLGQTYRPAPPVTEVLTAGSPGNTLALLLDLPEPLRWERISWSLARVGRHPTPSVRDALLTWSDDDRQAVLVRTGGGRFEPGDWSLQLELALDVGAERAVWTRGGSAAPEVGTLRFAVP
jgi:hypothetical protein